MREDRLEAAFEGKADPLMIQARFKLRSGHPRHKAKLGDPRKGSSHKKPPHQAEARCGGSFHTLGSTVERCKRDKR